MSVEFVLGTSGTGKSTYILEKIIKESIENTNDNFFLLVPEQFTMEVQREMVGMHPRGGSMNIDVIGFNRLCYRIFDEQNITLNKVLEDFGKSMLVRKAAGKIKDKLRIYGNSLNKDGFIDEAKSLMSELFMYQINREEVLINISSLSEDNLLKMKISDMFLIFDEFQKEVKDKYLVIEQIQEIASTYVEKSSLLKNSTIFLDGFTGFTPVQLRLLEQIMKCAKRTHIAITIDKDSYYKNNIRQHDLFHLSKETIENIKSIAYKNSIKLDDPKFISSINNEINIRFKEGHEIGILEKNLFRFPYEKYNKTPVNIVINALENPRDEAKYIASQILEMVKKEGLRYRDIAVVTGDLENMSNQIDTLFPGYNIPYFLDYNRKMSNNPFIQALVSYIRIIEENYSYESVFSFLKTGIFSNYCERHQIDYSEFCRDIEKLENYSIKKGIRGKNWWNIQTDNNFDYVREIVIKLTLPLFDTVNKEEVRVRDILKELYLFMEEIDYYNMIEVLKDEYATNKMSTEEKACKGLYDKLIDLFDKMDELLGDDKISIKEFSDIFELGVSEISMGIIPPTIDMVVVGDITRTRLGNIKVLFFANVNDGIIPKSSSGSKIINDRDRDELEELNVSLAPTSKTNSYIEQFYLYSNMTKPSRKLILSYSLMSNQNLSLTPAYIINRVKGVFPNIKTNYIKNHMDVITKNRAYETLISLINKHLTSDYSNLMMSSAIYKLLSDNEISLDYLEKAFTFNNTPSRIKEETILYIREKYLAQSISKLEQYANCAYSYFLKYGLSLKSRQMHEVTSRDMGDMIHGVLEKVFIEIRDVHQNKWNEISEIKIKELAENYSEILWKMKFRNVNQDNPRNKYLYNLVNKVAIKSLNTLKEHIVSGEMSPIYFEQMFSGKRNIDAAKISITNAHGDKEEINLTGVIDRADVKVSDQSVYMKIVDYKAGNKDIKFNHIYEGLQLQLLIYMNVLKEMAKSDFPNKEVVPAGLFYYRTHDSFTRIKKSEDEENEKMTAFRMSGIINSDEDCLTMLDGSLKEKSKASSSSLIIPYDTKRDGEVKSGIKMLSTEEIFTIIDYSMCKAKELAGEIISGNINKNPIKKGTALPCTYCEYGSVCRFDDRNGENKSRNLKYADLDKNALYELLKQGRDNKNAVD